VAGDMSVTDVEFLQQSQTPQPLLHSCGQLANDSRQTSCIMYMLFIAQSKCSAQYAVRIVPLKVAAHLPRQSVRWCFSLTPSDRPEILIQCPDSKSKLHQIDTVNFCSWMPRNLMPDCQRSSRFCTGTELPLCQGAGGMHGLEASGIHSFIHPWDPG